jgi:hypothetical protein
VGESLEKKWYFCFFNGNWRNIGSSTWDLTEYDGDRKNHAWKIAKETWMFSKIFIGDMGWDIYIYIHNQLQPSHCGRINSLHGKSSVK